MIFAIITGPHPRCPLPPHPNPPPRRGEGWVGVMSLQNFMQRLGKDAYFNTLHHLFCDYPKGDGIGSFPYLT